MNIVEKPCADCGTPVLDVDDPAFSDDWLCHWCHCLREGVDHRKRFNVMAEAVKLGACYMREYDRRGGERS